MILSRSVGLALLIASGGKTLAAIFTGGEVLLYMMYKLARNGFFWFPDVKGLLGVIISFFQRVCVKIITATRCAFTFAFRKLANERSEQAVRERKRGAN